MGVKRSIGQRLTPMVTERAPVMTGGFVREALRRAIDGVGPLPGAAAAAQAQLREQGGDVEQAVHELMENHIRYAGAQGFATNIGGVVTAAFAIPANITGLAVIQCRLIAGIAHLRGYDLTDPRVLNAVLVTIVGEEGVHQRVKKGQLPAPPMAIATAPAYDPRLDAQISAEVAGELVSRIAGKRLVTAAGRRVPGVGAVVGAGADSYVTWKIGRYADREFLPRVRR